MGTNMVFKAIPTMLFLLLSLFSVSESATLCENSFECVDSNMEDNLIECIGYQSCANAGSLVATNAYISCRGSYACYGNDLLSAPFFYDLAVGGVSNVTLLENDDEIECRGEKTCANTTMTSKTDGSMYALVCTGDRSASDSSISDIDGEVQALGSLALCNSEVSTALDSSGITVELSGYYSGLNLVFTCEEDQECEIECYGFSCTNLTLIGKNGSSFEIDCDSSNKNEHCPNGYDEDWLDNLDIYSLIWNDEINNGQSFEFTTIENSITECDGSNAITADDAATLYYEEAINLADDGSICCRGEDSCFFSPNMTLLRGRMIRCDGILSCKFAEMFVVETGDLYCSSRNSCRESYFTGSLTSSVVYCTGYYGCRQMEISSALHVLCTGEQSCRQTKITTVEEHVFALGDRGLFRAEVSKVSGNVYCLAGESCRQAELSDIEGNVYANGYRSLYNAEMSDIAGNLYVTGEQALDTTIIENIGGMVYVNSAQGLHDATINGFGSLEVHGDEAMSNTYITTNGNNDTVRISIYSEDNAYYEINCSFTDRCMIDLYNNDTFYHTGNNPNKPQLCCYGTCFINGTEISPYEVYCPHITKEEKEKSILKARLVQWTSIQRYFLGGMFIWCVFLTVAAMIHYRMGRSYHRSIDQPDYIAIWVYWGSFIDFLTDVVLCGVLFAEEKFFLFYLATAFTVVPFLLSGILGVSSISQWKLKSKKVGRRLLGHLRKYEPYIYAFTLFVTFYSAIDFCKSKLFYLNLTNLQIKKSEYEKLKYYRLINILLLRNAPQACIQILYLLQWSGNRYNELGISALVVTGISVLYILSIRAKDTKFDAKIHKLFGFKGQLSGKYVIDAPKINSAHSFCHKSMARCIEGTLGENLESVMDNYEAFFTVEVFYIERFVTNNQLNAHFELILYTGTQEENEELLKIIEQTVQEMGSSNASKTTQIYRKFRKVILHYIFFDLIKHASDCRIEFVLSKKDSKAVTSVPHSFHEHMEHFRDSLRHDHESPGNSDFEMDTRSKQDTATTPLHSEP